VKNIILRILSGIVYIAVIVIPILLYDNSAVAYLIVFPLFVVLGVNELIHMAKDEASESWLLTMVDWAGGVGLFMAFYMLNDTPRSVSMWVLPLAVYLLVRCILQLYRPRQNALRSLERSFFAILYVALPISLLNNIIAVSAPRILLAMFIFIWINDTGAFCVGSLIGKHPLFERISPHKTWEGFFGGLLACVGIAYAGYLWLNEFFEVPDLLTWMGLSVVVSVSATFGDLVESLIKRTVHVKDSGNLIPGHGGVLDRIDSLLLAAPAVLIFLIIMNYNH